MTAPPLPESRVTDPEDLAYGSPLTEHLGAIDDRSVAPANGDTHHQALQSFIEDLRGRAGDPALAGFLEALAARPEDDSALLGLSTELARLGLWSHAAVAAAHCVARDPRCAEGYHVVSHAYRALGKLTLSIAAGRRSVALDPANALYRANLAASLAQANETDEAIRCYEAAYRIDGDCGHLVRAMTLMPVVYRSVEHIEQCRSLLAEALRLLLGSGFRLPSPVDPAFSMFYLAYHGLNDREIMESMAAFVRRAVPASAFVASGLRRPGGGGIRRGRRKRRLGLVSTRFKQHTIGRLFLGMVRHFPRDDVEVVVFSPPHAEDPLVRGFREGADRYIVLPQMIDEIRRIIADHALDILFYPDVGMDPLTYGLAHARLAPAQVLSWGHPVTSGVPTLDFFLSSEDLETEGSEDHYSERLLRASRVTACYERPDLAIPAASRRDLGLPADGSLYLCPQTPMKLHPEFDEIIAGILRRDPCGIVALQRPWHDTAGDLVRQRLGARLGEDTERVIFVPPRRHELFLAMMKAADVMLDPLHFGGGNTNYEACHVGLPVVSLPSRFMRGRFCHALYRQMGIDDTIARDKADYVDKAVGIARDRSRRDRLSAMILERADRVFDDRAILEEVAAMFIQIVDERQPAARPARHRPGRRAAG